MDYKELLKKETFLNWMDEIIRTDDSFSIRTVAVEISKMVKDNYAVQSRSGYELLYKKYKFKIYPTNAPFGANYLRNVLYQYDGTNEKIVGLIQP